MITNPTIRRWSAFFLVAMFLAACSNPAPVPPGRPTSLPPTPVAELSLDGGSAPADAPDAPSQSAAATAAAEPTAVQMDTAPTAQTSASQAPVTNSPTSGIQPTAAVAPATIAPTAPPTARTTPTSAPTATTAPAALTTVAAQAAAPASAQTDVAGPVPTPTHTLSTRPNPLQIDMMRQQSYPGSDITIEQTLAPGANYSRYIASYRSDGLKIYGLLTVPNGARPPSGWPVIIFNHGYIPPAIYRTTERYVAYVDAIARSGYIVFKPDYRGHGNSEGSAQGGGYGTPAYTVDVLNALASLKSYKDADPNRIGMWGHSMGGQITLRAMVVSKDIKAGVIWGGVVAPYPDLISRWTRRAPLPPGPASGRRWRTDLINEYGTPAQNPGFWASISPNSYLADLSGPLQLDHSVTDGEVPVAFSQTLYKEAQAAGKDVELYTYPGDNHNINANFNTAMARSIAFFDKYVKNAPPAGQ